jgi:hypothetical protein
MSATWTITDLATRDQDAGGRLEWVKSSRASCPTVTAEVPHEADGIAAALRTGKSARGSSAVSSKLPNHRAHWPEGT